jgi:hypothetical protein
MAIIGWKAWFVTVPQGKDILCFHSEEIAYKDLPRDGCLGFVVFEDKRKPDGYRKREFQTGSDYYFKAGDIYGRDIDSRERDTPTDIAKRYTDPIIIRGIWTDDETMATVQEEMRNAQCR